MVDQLMSPTSNNIGFFQETFEGFKSSKVFDGQEHREYAFNKFVQAGIPNRKSENWRNVNLRFLKEQKYSLSDFSSPDDLQRQLAEYAFQNYVVFVNGEFNLAASKLPSGVVVEMSDWTKGDVDSSANPFAWLNSAFSRVCHLKITKDLEAPLAVIHTSFGDASGSNLVCTALKVDVENTENLEIHEIYSDMNSGEDGFMNVSSQINVAVGATVSHAVSQCNLAKLSLMTNLSVSVAANAKYKFVGTSKSSRFVRNNIDVKITGEQGYCQLDGLYQCGASEFVDNHTSIDHMVGNTMSDQLCKGVLDATGKAVFNGKVYVRQDAQKVEAFQLNKTLLLSSEAQIDTKPELQIDADDVKCSHGATISNLSRQELFYFQTRGVTRDVAERLLLGAHLDEVIIRQDSKQIRDFLKKF